MTNKKLILILISISASVLFAWKISSKWNEWEIGNQFVATFFIAIALGLFTVLVVLPSLADKIGAFFFSAPEQIKPDPLIKAAAKVSQGDYEGAINAYRAIALEEPENRFPVFEIAKIQQEYLRDVDAAIETFEDSLENNEWAENDAAAIMFRLQQIYLESKQDEKHATVLLQNIIDRFPDTRHSANAHHRLNEINKIG
tara:strand:+ start:1259 stop:1855 length:597 start_codon:yes stop_codon:yes gene_type:complete